MPPKELPSSYRDEGDKIPMIADAELAAELIELQAEGKWEFLSERQLDNNLQEWQEAARAFSTLPEQLKSAEQQIRSLTALHVTSVEALEDIFGQSSVTTHHYRVTHPDEFPDYMPRSGYPTQYEEALGLDDFVNFSFSSYSHFADRPGRVSLIVPATQILRRKETIVLPFDAPLYLSRTAFHERPSIIQAAALRGKDYLALLPTYIAATEQGQLESAVPAWFGRRFGARTYAAAELKTQGNLSLNGLNWHIEANSRDFEVEDFLSRHSHIKESDKLRIL